MIKRIVVTGATSSIGCALIDECLKLNIEILAIVNPGSSKIKWIPQSSLVQVVECSLSELSSKNFDSYGSYDALFHFAWQSTAGDEARNRLGLQAQNIEYALDAVSVAEKLGCGVFVGAGSQAEYGRTSEVLTEETVPHPETAYGMAKLCTGQMTRLMCKQKGIKHIWPRILSGYGPKCQRQSVINYTLTELLLGNEPKLSKGEQIWNFIYTGDIANALLELAEKGKDGEVYVIGAEKSLPLCTYLTIARDIVNPNCTLDFGAVPYSKDTVMHLECDNSKLKRDTGFVAKVSFEDGIRKTAEWIKNESGYIKKED